MRKVNIQNINKHRNKRIKMTSKKFLKFSTPADSILRIVAQLLKDIRRRRWDSSSPTSGC